MDLSSSMYKLLVLEDYVIRLHHSIRVETVHLPETNRQKAEYPKARGTNFVHFYSSLNPVSSPLGLHSFQREGESCKKARTGGYA